MKKILSVICILLTILLCSCSMIPKFNNSEKQQQVTKKELETLENDQAISSNSIIQTEPKKETEPETVSIEQEKNIVSEAISKAEKYIDESKYAEAESVINNALKTFPNNKNLQEVLNKIKKQRPIYLLEEMKPYKTESSYEDDNVFSMGGKEYSHGFTCTGFGNKPYWNGTFFNLEGKYSELRFTAGIVEDSANDTVNIAIYTDGERAYHFEMNMGDLPTEHTVDISGCKQLIFSVKSQYDYRSGTYGFADIIVTPNNSD